MRMRISTAMLITFLATTFFTYGQSQNSDILDPYGFVTKYDTKFEGVGPRVYILPVPRTLKDEMIDTYKELRSFQDSILIGLQYERVLNTFKKTSNYQIVNKILPDTIANQEFNNLLQQFVNQNNHSVVYALYNDIAEGLLHQKNTSQAIDALNKALSHAQSINNSQDIAIIQSNLASIYLATNKLDDALELENKYLDYAVQTKNQSNQASSQSRIALIHAYKKNYNIAENTIIRKAIPLFNKSKFYAGKINAWIILAEIYRLQNKHTEAQWFLLQARDLAKEKELNEALAMIEYMLGSSKLIQANYKIAKEELETAWQLTKNENTSYLQMAIVEQLGRSYVYLRDYESAKSYLDEYLSLRKSLFSKKITTIL